jgi:hypothetical protein
MKIIITESQYKLLNEQLGKSIINEDSPISLGCHDIDKVDTYCGNLKLDKKELDTIISQNQTKAISSLNLKIDEFIKELVELGGDDAKILTKKFSSSIQKLKPSIIKTISQYYPQAVYASGKLSKPINHSLILSTIIGMIYDEFIKIWGKSWVEKQGAKYIVDKDNIENIKRQAKDIWYKISEKFRWVIESFYENWGYFPVEDLVVIKNKVTEKCTSVILTHDKMCNKLKVPVHPNKKYITDYPFLTARSSEKEFSMTDDKYISLIYKLLDELV